MVYQFLAEKLGLRFLPVAQNLNYLAEGIYLTNIITGAAFLLACMIGLVLALSRMSKIRILSAVATGYIESFRSMPLLVSVFGIYYCLPALNVRLPSVVCAIIAMTLSCSCYMAENYRSGFQSIRPGQIEAGRSIALSPSQIFRRIIFPQSLRVTTPLAVNLLAGMLRWSSLVSVIGVQELVFRAEFMVSKLYLPVEFFSAIAIYYIVVSSVLSRIASRLENKWRKIYSCS
jgi:His/Glu/Gln/Arg/opine family amino acid ABC transporter permease subunit